VVLHVAGGPPAEGPARIVSADGDFGELTQSGIERLDPTDVDSWRHGVEERPPDGLGTPDPPEGVG
jgi:hypothetical protein